MTTPAAVDLAALCHVELCLLHARLLPLHHSDTSAERWAAQAVLESARRQILRIAPNWTPTTKLLRVYAHEAIGHHCGGLLVVGARRSRHPGLGLVTRTTLYHANSPVAVVAAATGLRLGANPPVPHEHAEGLQRSSDPGWAQRLVASGSCSV
jgi:hypothetical protein